MSPLVILSLWVFLQTPAHEELPVSAPIGQRIQDPLQRTNINLGKSKVYWRGTKLMGTGSHAGTVALKGGELVFGEGRLTGGNIVVDMTSIYITDIPLSDPIPRRNLTAHLKSDFDTKTYPEARFSISRMGPQVEDQLTVTGDLTIRGVTHPVTVPVTIRNSSGGKLFETTFSINRFKWGIGEDGSWLEKKLVDDEFELRVEILASVTAPSGN